MPIEQLSLLDLQPQPELEAEPLPAVPIPERTPPVEVPVTPADESPLEPFQMGQKVIVSGIDGDWVGTVYQDSGDRYVWVLQSDRPTALAYERAQVRRQPQPGEKSEEELKLLAFEAELRRWKEEVNPKVDCNQCVHCIPYCVWPRRTTVGGVLYSCAIAVFPPPCSLMAPYGIHIGCNKFEQKEITE